MADEADLANNELQQAVDRATAKFYENIEQRKDLDGAVICRDCAEEIPPERAAITGVTRCMHCQEQRERESVKRK